LRRGIIEACNLLEKLPLQKQLTEYFFGLKQFLPLQEPSIDKKEKIFLHLARAIVHHWDGYNLGGKYHIKSSIPEKELGFVLKNTRNWLSHDSLLKKLDEKFIAFIFLINLRTLSKVKDIGGALQFKDNKLKNFEKILLSIFELDTLPENMGNIVMSFYDQTVNIAEHTDYNTNIVNFLKRKRVKIPNYNQTINSFHETRIPNVDYQKLLVRGFVFSIYKQVVESRNSNRNIDPNHIGYSVYFKCYSDTSFYLHEFEKCFYKLSLGPLKLNE